VVRRSCKAIPLLHLPIEGRRPVGPGESDLGRPGPVQQTRAVEWGALVLAWGAGARITLPVGLGRARTTGQDRRILRRGAEGHTVGFPRLKQSRVPVNREAARS